MAEVLFAPLACASGILAFVAAFASSKNLGASIARSRLKKKAAKDSGLQEKIIHLMREESFAGTLKFAKGPLAIAPFSREAINLAGLSGQVTLNGFVEARAKISLSGALVGFLIGILVSTEFAFVLAIVCFAFLFSYCGRLIKGIANERTLGLERELPQMLDVLALGVSSGLSFDRSLEIYCSSFECDLANDLKVAQNLWMHGLKSREEALRDVANSYNSQIFHRLIENLIRSLKLGSALTSNLRDSAAEARAIYKAQREENVRRAPIKMLIPTGALILPAMLILVMGPVLLELVSGGGI